MKKLVVICIMMFVALVSDAQHSGVHFFKGSFEEAVAKANAEGKKLFIDCYTTWCKPCRAVDSLVFPTETAGIYFNANFINVKVDAEKGEGPAFAKDFKIEGYPTFMVLNPDKTVHVRWAGGSLKPTPEKFIEKVKTEIASVAGKAAETALPVNEAEYQQLSASLAAEKSLEKQDVLITRLVRSYPDRHVSPNTVYGMVQYFAEKKDKQKVWFYVNLMKRGADSFMYGIAVSMAADIDPVGAVPVLKGIVDSLNKDGVVKAGPMESGSIFINAYATALTASGRGEEAFQLISPLYQANPKSPFKSVYVDALLSSGRLKEAYPYIEDALQAGVATTKMKQRYKEAYIAVNGSASGFEKQEKKLLDVYTTMLKEEISKAAVQQAAADFTLTDVNGKAVTLSDLKGKVVVLDFWATWCGPCKRSFPAMQMAVNKYKNDPGVQFFFIHTKEKGSGDPTQEAKEYIYEHQYAFNVLMDLRDPATKISKVAELFKITGIPAKLVIDPAGNIRYSVTGFNGNNERTVDELSLMIEQARG